MLPMRPGQQSQSNPSRSQHRNSGPGQPAVIP
jgi:hypothetical protein